MCLGYAVSGVAFVRHLEYSFCVHVGYNVLFMMYMYLCNVMQNIGCD